jgi:hypothetical protein
VATGVPEPLWQWQVSTDGGATWSDVADGAPYSGARLPVLTITSPPVTLHGRRYRAVATNMLGSATSDSAVLSVTGFFPTPSTLRFAGRRAGPVTAPEMWTTAPQTVTVTAAGLSATAWTATADQAWVQITGGSGTGAGQFSVAVDGAAFLSVNGTFVSTITIAGGGGSPSATIPVTFVVHPEPVSAIPPVGVVDTPLQDATGVQGAIAMTGWAVDDVGVTQVRIYRSCLPAEVGNWPCHSPGGLRGLSNVVELGEATIVPGARPDVEALYGTYPAAQRAGWGFMILSNMLPNVPAGTPQGGVGRMDLWAMAWGEASDVTVLGRTTEDRDPTRITAANDTIAKPFGAIDTPGQGATVSGTVNNFGWVLTPDPGTGVLVPTDGSTITVFLDGAAVGSATYNLCRGSVAVGGMAPTGVLCDDDVSTAFRGDGSLFRNLDAGRGPIGLRSIDTTSFTNGLHTLSWSVTDSASRAEGIGSRYINVVNGAADPYVARRELPRRETGGLRDSGTTGRRDLAGPLYARTGFDMRSAYAPLAVTADGVAQVRIPELGRVELQVPGVVSGNLLVNGEARALPIGVGIDRERGLVTWAPGAGFLGTYRLAFSGANPGTTEPRDPGTSGPRDPGTSGPRDPGTSGPRDPGTSGPRDFVIDVSVVPAQQATEPVRMHLDTVRVEGPALSERTVRVEGWALDPQAWTGSGVGAVHVWARRRGAACSVLGAGCESPVFLGVATLGLSRPDVAAAHGAEFGDAGLALTGVLPEAGEWEITAYVWIDRTGRFEDARSVTIIVR